LPPAPGRELAGRSFSAKGNKSGKKLISKRAKREGRRRTGGSGEKRSQLKRTNREKRLVEGKGSRRQLVQKCRPQPPHGSR